MRPKYITILICMLFLIQGVNAQTPVWRWVKASNGDEIIQSDNDSVGNTYVMGTFYGDGGITINNVSYAGGNGTGEVKNMYVAKFNAAGQMLWAHVFFGDEEYSEVDGIKFDINQKGDIVILAESSNNPVVHVGRFDLEFSNPNHNVFVTKISKTGFVLWTRKIEVTEGSSQIVYGKDIVLCENGRVAATGYFFGQTLTAGVYNVTGFDLNEMMYVVKYNPYGDEEWLKSAEYNGEADSLYITGELITSDESENIYVAGNYRGSGEFIFGTDTSVSDVGKNIFLTKYVDNGDEEWARFFAGDNTDVPENLVLDDSNNIILVGLFSSLEMNVEGIIMPNSGNNYDQFIIKLSPTGVRLFAEYISSQIEFLNQTGRNTVVSTDIDNNVLVATSFRTATTLGGAQTNAETGTLDLLFVKYNSVTGDIEWSLTGSYLGDNSLGAVEIDKFGNIFTTGSMNNNISIDGTDILDTQGYNGFYIVKISSEGALGLFEVKLNPYSGSAYADDIGTDVFGNIYLTGEFGGDSISFGNTDMVDEGSGGLFFAQLSLTSSISGEVIDAEGSTVTDGMVYLIGHTRFQQSPRTDSVVISANGLFEFNDIPYGRYILLAAPEENAPWLQTYYPEEDYWENAERIVINSPVIVDNISIMVFERDPLTGANSLEGNLSQMEEEDVFKSEMQANPVPVKEASVVLVRNKLKSDYEVIATTKTDISGNFAFYGVDDGFYLLYIDVPGIVHTDYYEVWISGGQLLDNLDYYMDEETVSKVYPTGIEETVSSSTLIQISPNPAHNYITIDILKAESDIDYQIFDMQGRLLINSTVKSSEFPFSLNISSLKEGHYLIKVSDNMNVTTNKIIKY